ncbi:MAG TPA: VWD domain-containing protein [Vicinamibacterales bacterium]|nr:VWD domain-containing protein [Vicinamibacterales bacterium]
MRPRIVALILAAAIVVAFAFWFAHRSRPPAGAPASTAAPPAAAASSAAASLASSQHRIQIEINHLGLTPERAKQLFSLTVGPLPGVSLDGLTKDPNEFDGTAAVLYLRHEWSALTPEQQQAASVLMYGSPTTRGRSGSLFLPERWAMHPPRVMLAGFGASPTDDLPAHDYQSLADNANNTIAPLLGVAPIPQIVDVRMDASNGTEFADTTSWGSKIFIDPNTGDFQRFADGKCHIKVWNDKFAPLDDPSAMEVLAHELTHCYQDAWAGTYNNRAAQPRWVADGEADWVGATIVPAGQAIDKYWPPYIFAPKTVYSDRWYDAIGVFGHLSDITSASVVWSRLASTAVTSQSGDDAATLAAFIQGISTSYYSTWGASYFQQSNYRWKIAGPGHPTYSGPAPDEAVINPGTVTTITAASYQATLTNVSGGSDIVGIELLSGYGRVHDQGWGVDTALDSSGPLLLCLREAGCKCDGDSEGEVPDTKKATAPIAIGIDGGDQVALVGLAGKSLNDFCKKKPEKTPKPTPPGGGGGGGGGGDPQEPDPKNPGNGDSVGDPHLKTFDGFRFDFQHIGEYTLVRSTKDDFVVQVRQVPVPGSRAVSVNQSVATKVGGKRVTVALENGAAVLRIDGAVVTDEAPVIAGVSLTRAQTGYGVNYVFEWPDGTIVRAEQLGRYTINVRVRPSQSRLGSLEGLLGKDHGSGINDTAESAALVEKWAVPSSASLFDYQPGQTAATFIDPTFPDPSATVPNRDAAEKACREQGITDSHLLHDCIIDFGVTNGFLFASQYAHQQRVLEARASLAPMNTSVTAAPKEKVIVMAGTITDKSQPTEFKFEAQANDVIYMHQPDCVDRDGPDAGPIYFLLFGPDGQRVGGGVPGCDLGRIDLPTTGTYTFKGNLGKHEIGKYSVPIRFVRHDRVATIKYGDIVSGNIEEKAAHDVYTFDAQEGDLIRISGKGCELNMFTAIVSSEGWENLGPGCREGTVYRIPKAGTYKLRINSDERGPGKYQFVFQGVSGK